MSQPASAPTGPDYSKSLYLPQTAFPMRAGLPKKEPELLARWAAIDLYGQLRRAGQGRPKFVLHDGPPYANGAIHIGHALNKILKDLVTRSAQMTGFEANYVPGWDCHGLPIEWKIEEEYRAQGRNKDEVPVVEFRRQCREFARRWVDIQREEFKRLGVTGDWANPYETMSFAAEAQIAREIMAFAANGLLYRGSKPVMWSVVEKTALAEAEVEYEDYVSDTVYVAFPVKAVGRIVLGENTLSRLVASDPDNDQLRDAYVVIWTTTPWTMPANRAVSLNKRLFYTMARFRRQRPEERKLRSITLAELTDLERDHARDLNLSEKFMVFEHNRNAKRLRDIAFEGEKSFIIEENLFYQFMALIQPDEVIDIVEHISGESLLELTLDHPFKSLGYNFDIPMLDGEHVTADTGTGFVHTAPSHGRDDFDVWTANTRQLKARGIDTRIPYTVDADGRLTTDAPGFVGRRVLDDHGVKGDANEAVIEALSDVGALVARGHLPHQYPHSWRSKKPLIFRNTPQWFIALDKPFAAAGEDRASLRATALEEINKHAVGTRKAERTASPG